MTQIGRKNTCMFMSKGCCGEKTVATISEYNIYHTPLNFGHPLLKGPKLKGWIKWIKMNKIIRIN